MAKVFREIISYSVPEFVEHSEDLLNKWEQLQLDFPDLADEIEYIYPSEVGNDERPGLYISSENSYLMEYNESGWTFNAYYSNHKCANKDELLALHKLIGDYSWEHTGRESYGGLQFWIYVSVDSSGIYYSCEEEDRSSDGDG